MQGEMSGSEKKTDVRQFIQKMCNKEVSYRSPTKQRHRNVQKSVLRVQSCFFLIRPIVVFHRSSAFPSPLNITRFDILFEQTLNIIESFAFSPG